MKSVDLVNVMYLHTCDYWLISLITLYIEGFSFTQTKDKKNNESLDINVCIYYDGGRQ